MERLMDPILQDCVRLIERHPDLSPQYKARLLQGLSTIDGELKHYVRPAIPVQDPPTAAKAGKR